MSTGILSRAAAWWETKRLEWQAAQVIVDEVANGWVPTPEQVGLPPETDVPDEFEESRPAALPACGRCDGQGMFVDVIEGEAGWVTCGWCSGTGNRGAA